MTLKGRSRPARRVCARTAAAPAAPRAAAGHTGPFVGRDRELRELTDLFTRRSTRDGAAGSCRSSGIAGIGKSRLAWEFDAQSLDGIPDAVAWHVGRAPAYGEGIAFAAVAEMVRGAPDRVTATARRAGPPAARLRARGVRPRRRGAALDRAAPGGAARARTRPPPSSARSCSPPGGASSSASPSCTPGGARLRGPAVGRSEPARLHRAPGDLVPGTSDPDRRARPARAARTGARRGAPGSAASPRSTSSGCPTTRWASCSGRGAATSPRTRAADPGRAPVACRSTRSRSSAC